MRRSAVPLMALALTAAIPALARTPGTSERYAYSTFRHEAAKVTVLVDGFPASLHPHDAYVPIPIVVANTETGASVPLTPESFKLVDASGHAVAAAGFEELLNHYGKLAFDRSMIRERPLVIGSTYDTYFKIQGSFYPAPGTRTRVDRVEVPPFSYYHDVVYFPMPPGGLKGVMTLEVSVPGAERVGVKFVASAKELAKR